METKLFDSELKLMQLLWQAGEAQSAKELSLLAAQQIGWNKNTTYTVIKKLVEKGAIRREEPGFMCHAQLQERDALLAEADSLAGRFFAGSKKALFSALLAEEDLSAEELQDLKRLIEEKQP